MQHAQAVNDENIEAFLEVADKEIPLYVIVIMVFLPNRQPVIFAEQGFKEVYSIEGGWEEWKAAYV